MGGILSIHTKLTGKIRVGLILHVLDNCDFFNVERGELLNQCNLNEVSLIDPNSFISFIYFEKIILYLYKNSKDSLVVLKFFEKNNSLANGVLGYLIEISSSLQNAIETFEKYFELNGSIGKIELSKSTEDIMLEWKCFFGGADFVRYATEYKLAWWAKILYLIKSDSTDILKAVHFKHDISNRSDNKFYNDFFKCPVYFGQSESAIILSKNALELPLVTANRALYENIESFAKSIIKESGEISFFSNNVRSLLYSQLYSNGNFSREFIAEKLEIGVRTLSRRLHEENTKYSLILDEVRFELAKKYLENYDHKISHISKSLGFYTSNAFITWFKFSTNKSPQKYREDFINSQN